jgi:hypothetical protein
MPGPALRPPAAADWPEAGSAAERRRFEALQAAFPRQVERVFPDVGAPRTVVVVPSLSLPAGELRKISGVHHYEERMLFMLMLLRMPRTQVIYLTSQPIAPGIVDYYLQLLAGVPSVHARTRLTLLACHDGSAETPLTEKVLARPRLLRRIRESIHHPDAAHLACFNATPLERTLAVRLGIPLYACDPELDHLGTKSGSRTLFRQAGLPLPDGAENLRDLEEAAAALAALRRRAPALRRAVVKLNDGFSGEGNAVFSFDGAPDGPALDAWVAAELPRRLRFEAPTETFAHYADSFARMGGIVEAWIDGAEKRSPSVQGRIDPLGHVSVVSTHDQVLGGPSGQVFLGCTFPAVGAYRLEIQALGQRVGEALAAHGAIGRFGLDLVSTQTPDGWQHHAIEINLRKGGTTHPFLMLDFLTDGSFDAESGLYRSADGSPRYYMASDNLVQERYRGLTPRDLIDIVVENRLHVHAGTQEGVVFHLIGALSEFGKLGLTCIGRTPEHAKDFFDRTVAVLDAETGAGAPTRT